MSEQDVVKAVLRRMPYGLYALTTCTEDDANAMLVNWTTQVSFQPRLLAVAVEKTSYSYSLMEKSRRFALNLFLQSDQQALKGLTKSRHKNPEKMRDVRYAPAPQTGCPILEAAAAYLECRIRQIVDTGGDHYLIIGEVVGAGEKKPGPASATLNLPEMGWNYGG